MRSRDEQMDEKDKIPVREKKTKYQLGVDEFPKKKEDYYKRLQKRYSACRITMDIANSYYENAKEKTYAEQIELRSQLIERYGVTELEATNILRGFHISDYVRKYELMSRGIFFNVYSKTSYEMEKS